ncbi:hypothetical protein ACTUM7_06560 [Basfia succiniciproducens]|uniref:hypothetical protein n=1 Tax=Basfia succiniciproducens TaxID=653940 RepID=UPI003FCDCC29
MNNNASLVKCPSCGADLLDWRNYSPKDEIDKIKPFECTGLHCGKRWSEEELGVRNESEFEKRS